MEKERKVTAPEGCEIEKVEIVDGVAVVTFREKERKLPKSWEEFCDMYNVSDAEYYIDEVGGIRNALNDKAFISRNQEDDANLLPDHATAEAVLALCQLIQLRKAYNGDWVADWNKGAENKYCIDFAYGDICTCTNCVSPLLLYFKTEKLRNEFTRNFRPLIEKLKPLYGIMEGGKK